MVSKGSAFGGCPREGTPVAKDALRLRCGADRYCGLVWSEAIICPTLNIEMSYVSLSYYNFTLRFIRTRYGTDVLYCGCRGLLDRRAARAARDDGGRKGGADVGCGMVECQRASTQRTGDTQWWKAKAHSTLCGRGAATTGAVEAGDGGLKAHPTCSPLCETGTMFESLCAPQPSPVKNGGGDGEAGGF
jgi:hypothetical protein